MSATPSMYKQVKARPRGEQHVEKPHLLRSTINTANTSTRLFSWMQKEEQEMNQTSLQISKAARKAGGEQTNTSLHA